MEELPYHKLKEDARSTQGRRGRALLWHPLLFSLLNVKEEVLFFFNCYFRN